MNTRFFKCFWVELSLRTGDLILGKRGEKCANQHYFIAIVIGDPFERKLNEYYHGDDMLTGEVYCAMYLRVKILHVVPYAQQLVDTSSPLHLVGGSLWWSCESADVRALLRAIVETGTFPQPLIWRKEISNTATDAPPKDKNWLDLLKRMDPL